MAISDVKKVLLVVHKDEKEALVKELQKASIIHISDIWQSNLFDELKESEKPLRAQRDDILQRLKRVINGLKAYAPPSGGGLFGGGREKVSSKEYHEIVKNYDPSPVLEKYEQIKRRQNNIKLEKNTIRDLINSLSPWEPMDYDVTEFGERGDVVLTAGTVPVKSVELLKDASVEFEEVNRDSKKVYVVVAYLKEKQDDVKKALMACGFEPFDFSGLKGKVSEILANLKDKLRELELEEGKLEAELAELASERRKLLVIHDYYATLFEREKIEELSFATNETFILEGWVLKDNWDKFNGIVDKFESATVVELPISDDEKPPIALKNKKFFRPYELITEMYGLPDFREVDPTPLLTPFFIVFFGVCLTDAGYGLVIALFSLWLMKKMGASNKLLAILAGGGLFTIIAGALTGGWFGDLFVRFNMSFLNSIRMKLMWFDPMQEPMKFFYISLAMGYIQILFGLMIGFYNKWKLGEKIDGIANELAWIIVLMGLVLLYVAHFEWAKWPIYLGLALILFLSSKSKNPILRVFEGLYNIYNGIGFVGDLLSYVRLMALGMVTAGIAMAVNITAQLVKPIPFVGWLIAILILIGGHIFSIAVNVLGAFVHTMRLQYVEFFTHFYTDGGKPFRPFSERYDFVEVEN